MDLDLYNRITRCISFRDGRRQAAIKGKRTIVLKDSQNDYYKDKLPVIPAGTEIQLDFAGDFGCYAIASVNGKIHKIKFFLEELDNIDWSFMDDVPTVVNFVKE